MRTPAAIAQRAATILGGNWAAERGHYGVNGRLTAPETGTFTLHVDDHGHLVLEAALDRFGEFGEFTFFGEIARFPEPPAEERAEDVARGVAKAIRQHLANAEDEGESSVCRELNLEAHFSAADYSDPEMPCHPNVTIAGATGFFYIDEAGVLRVSVHLDGLTEIGIRLWGEDSVPMQITLDGGVVFASTGRWVIQFQHPDDGGDDGLWEYSIPADEAPTEAAARAVAQTRFEADIKSHSNTSAWDGTTIRSVRFTADQPKT
ncbi:hypothetical protein [Streptomyces canus]|uniref:hypothetical protein n=1 Tax=Streptomyces canus TaxID=58343 RepID=UPI00277ED15C|nr:hypothetical protein [Streptomyces canus]MDQ0765656.1 hypothetical protein [Streptomyces canus]